MAASARGFLTTITAPSRSYTPSVPRPGRSSGALAVEVLEQVVGGQFDRLVVPLRGPVDAGDEGRPVYAPEVAVDEGVAGLGLIGGPLGQGQVPVGVFLARVL